MVALEINDVNSQTMIESSSGTKTPTSSIQDASRLEDSIIGHLAASVDEFEQTRIAHQNRLRSVRGDDGRGPLDMSRNVTGLPLEADLVELCLDLMKLERHAVKKLERAMAAHCLGPWIKQQRGLGFKQVGRLLASIGDPYLRTDTGTPRTVSQLWRWTGFHVVDRVAGGDAGQWTSESQICNAGVAPRRTRGVSASWNHTAHARAYLVANACVRQLKTPCARGNDDSWAEHVEGCACGQWRRIYDAGRYKYADAEISDLHKHNRALRLVSKELLKQLWIESRRLHMEGRTLDVAKILGDAHSQCAMSSVQRR